MNTMIIPTFSDFVCGHLGSRNWVVSQRSTPRLRERYGEDVIVLGRKRYDEIKKMYDYQYPCACGNRHRCCGTCERKAAA